MRVIVVMEMYKEMAERALKYPENEREKRMEFEWAKREQRQNNWNTNVCARVDYALRKPTYNVKNITTSSRRNQFEQITKFCKSKQGIATAAALTNGEWTYDELSPKSPMHIVRYVLSTCWQEHFEYEDIANIKYPESYPYLFKMLWAENVPPMYRSWPSMQKKLSLTTANSFARYDQQSNKKGPADAYNDERQKLWCSKQYKAERVAVKQKQGLNMPTAVKVATDISALHHLGLRLSKSTFASLMDTYSGAVYHSLPVACIEIAAMLTSRGDTPKCL